MPLDGLGADLSAVEIYGLACFVGVDYCGFFEVCGYSVIAYGVESVEVGDDFVLAVREEV